MSYPPAVRARSSTTHRLALAVLAGALALALVLFVLRTPRARAPRELAPTSPAAHAEVPKAAPPPVTPPLEAARIPTESPRGAPPVARTGKLVLLLEPPPELGDADVMVAIARADGQPEAPIRLSRGAPRHELECAPGDLVVRARSDEPPLASLPTQTSIQAGSSALVRLLLVPSARLRALLRDEDGLALDDVQVTLLGPGGLRSEARSDAAGRVVLEPVPAGPYGLLLGDPRGPLVPRQELTLGPLDPPREFVLPVLVTLTLTVVDSSAQPVADARIEGTGKPGGHLSGATDVDGRFVAERLPPGEYRIFARHATLGRGTCALVLEARPADARVELVLYR